MPAHALLAFSVHSQVEALSKCSQCKLPPPPFAFPPRAFTPPHPTHPLASPATPPLLTLPRHLTFRVPHLASRVPHLSPRVPRAPPISTPRRVPRAPPPVVSPSPLATSRPPTPVALCPVACPGPLPSLASSRWPRPIAIPASPRPLLSRVP
ncbi:hypothetical protein BOTBODRAFT_178729 [Botryobasidium botryosum FD-172 SS1]|uniref:Uncharacterized protein n=1 Tax=Botryobasidium botryosum (strain FD-172 SS1) TaxID=930990 RepID=A0A067MDA5_BOTB1|nr:hypothetical protein BOTBODRAFT_178729 [Botryobasidium botryosum FD-172 SS1]